MIKCKSCKHWHNNQIALFSNPHQGFCTCPQMDYTPESGGKAMCFLNNELDNFTPKKAMLVTSEDFGCVLHELK